MTIIVAQKTDSGVALAADNTMADGSRIIRKANPKIVTITSRIAVGCAGLVRLGDVVRDPDRWPLYEHSDLPLFERKLGQFFRDLLKDEEHDTPFWAIVAVDQEIFYVGPGGSMARVDAPYCALGSAELVALGALHVLHRHAGGTNPPTGEDARRRLVTALEACAEHVEAIRPPWSFTETRVP